MIASNYRKHPEALAQQLCLDFGAVLRWATARPGSRILRAIRAQRAAAMKAQPTAPAWLPPLTIGPDTAMPAWAKEAAARARQLAKATRAACRALFA